MFLYDLFICWNKCLLEFSPFHIAMCLSFDLIECLYIDFFMFLLTTDSKGYYNRQTVLFILQTFYNTALCPESAEQ